MQGKKAWIQKSKDWRVRVRPQKYYILQFPNAVVLNAVGRRNTQMRKRKFAKERQKAQRSAKERFCVTFETTRFKTTRFGNSQYIHFQH